MRSPTLSAPWPFSPSFPTFVVFNFYVAKLSPCGSFSTAAYWANQHSVAALIRSSRLLFNACREKSLIFPTFSDAQSYPQYNARQKNQQAQHHAQAHVDLDRTQPSGQHRRLDSN